MPTFKQWPACMAIQKWPFVYYQHSEHLVISLIFFAQNSNGFGFNQKDIILIVIIEINCNASVNSTCAPRVGKCPAPWQCKICKCPTPGTDKVDKCAAVARVELTDARIQTQFLNVS